MKRINGEYIRNLSRRAHSAVAYGYGSTLVWWDMEADEFVCLRSSGAAAQLLTRWMDREYLRCYVGLFEPGISRGEIEAAMQAHADGRLEAA